MSSSQNKCHVCGGSDMNIVNGFYYCVECGTQDTTLQETLIDVPTLSDGTFALTTVRKTQVIKENIEMTPEWHKLHTFNFILSGLADELISLGASSTFKTKLLWIWTRYINKYHERNTAKENEDVHDSDKEDYSKLDELHKTQIENDTNEKKEFVAGTYTFVTDIKTITMGLLYAMCYAALNLDGSDIQLSDLCRFIREEKVSHRNYCKLIPEGLKVNSIPKWRNFSVSTHHMYVNRTISYLAYILFRKLDLGPPKIPKFYKIIDRFITELCLPRDIKNISLALAQRIKFVLKNKRPRFVPDYETLAMAYILMTMKICFGLDDEYEIKLSDTVEEINRRESHLKSYIGIDIDVNERLFSFREWYNYMEFRKMLLCKYNAKMAVHNNQEVDDAVFIHQMKTGVKQDTVQNVGDKIVMELLDKIDCSSDKFDIPDIDLNGSLTPLTDYTELLISHIEDPNLRLVLSENFSVYSLKYIFKGLELKINEYNIFVGISEKDKIIKQKIIGNLPLPRQRPTMVYVRNCENKKWLVTKRPKLQHITTINNDDNEIDKSGENEMVLEEFESKYSSIALPDCEVSSVLNGNTGQNQSNEEMDLNSSSASLEITDLNNDSVIKNETDLNEASSEKENMNLDICLTLEEDTDLNIFDDDFKEIKEENDIDQQDEVFSENGNLNHQIDSVLGIDDDSGNIEPLLINENIPKSLNKDELIKELIKMKCKEFKIPLPADMKPPPEPKKTIDPIKKERKRRRYEVPTKNEVDLTSKEIVASYLTKLHNDYTYILAESLQNAIRNSFSQNTSPENPSASSLNTTENDLNSTDINERQNLPCLDQEDDDDDDCVAIVNNGTALDDRESQPSTLKDDPNFNEDIFDINQLYIGMKRKRKIDYVYPEIDSQLQNILDKDVEVPKSIKEKDTKIDKSKPANSRKRYKLTKLIDLKGKHIKSYKYWFREYTNDALQKNRRMSLRFNQELDDHFPRSFTYVLRACASILECSTLTLYIQLVKLERLLKKFELNNNS